LSSAETTNEIPLRFRLESYDYQLPEALIAQRPVDRRDQSKLLVVPSGEPQQHAMFAELGEYLRQGDLLVANDTRVIRARFSPKRRGGGRAEVLLLHPAATSGEWLALVRPGKRVRKGDLLSLDERSGIEIVDWSAGGNRIVRFYGIDAYHAMARFGAIPLPPYIDRPPPDADARYQTVYARRDGSVAAPTAGLHFTPALIADLRAQGIEWTVITLDVGVGTFRPVKADDVREHAMHAERYEIGEDAARAVRDARASGRRVIAVGTTSLRALEASAAHNGGSVTAERRETDLFIYPPYRFVAVDALLTNFHLPRSSLLMLVAAFAGRDRILRAYCEAIRERYRFYSFGDAMLVVAKPDMRRGTTSSVDAFV
jgi:S-adenosylmethionine:tRNA ribosyltransferase-isomerase